MRQGWTDGRSCAEAKISEIFFFWPPSALERGNAWGVRGEGGGVRGDGILWGTWLTSCAPLACITLIEWRTSADAVSEGIVSKACRIERREGKRTDSTLTITLVDAEHSNVSPEVTLTMGRLLADDHPDGMRDALRICLEQELLGEAIAHKKQVGARTRKER